jgi:LysR family transcriptional regulator (chromosome initiation inhibitor)
MEYVAICATDFMRRHFPAGINVHRLQSAPMMRFDRRDQLQANWAQEACGARISPPTHWTPSTQGMLDMTLAGLGWSMAPLPLAEPLIAAKRLVEMPSGKRIRVKLYWQRTRLAASILDRLTEAVRMVAGSELIQPA